MPAVLSAYAIAQIIFYSFHLSVVILLFAKNDSTFKGPFYTIFKFVQISYLLNFYCLSSFQYSQLILSYFPSLNTSYIFGTFQLSLLSYVNVVIYLGHLLMAFNRFTLIIFPIKYQKIWDNRQWYTVLLLVLPFLSICWRLHEPALYGGPSGAQYLNPDVSYQQFLCGTIVHFSATLITGILNISFFIKFSFSKTLVNINERNLFFVTAFTFVTQLLRICFTLSQVMPTNTTLSFFAKNFMFINDAFALSGSLSLLVLSSTARKAYLSFYLCKKSSSSKLDVKSITVPTISLKAKNAKSTFVQIG